MEELAGKSHESPNRGMLDAIGLTEDVLCEVLTGSADHSILANLEDTPSYCVLIELYFFCVQYSSLSKLKLNIVLKKCVDALFPSCTVSRADRLERRVRGFCVAIDSMPEPEKLLFLQKHWRPQPTGSYYMLLQLDVS